MVGAAEERKIALSRKATALLGHCGWGLTTNPHPRIRLVQAVSGAQGGGGGGYANLSILARSSPSPPTSPHHHPVHFPVLSLVVQPPPPPPNGPNPAYLRGSGRGNPHPNPHLTRTRPPPRRPLRAGTRAMPSGAVSMPRGQRPCGTRRIRGRPVSRPPPYPHRRTVIYRHNVLRLDPPQRDGSMHGAAFKLPGRRLL